MPPKPIEDRTPAEQILAECSRTLRAMEGAADDSRCPDTHHRALTMLLVRMIMPIYRAFNNGGVPSKPANGAKEQEAQAAGLEIPTPWGKPVRIRGTAITGFYRTVLLLAVLYLVAVQQGILPKYLLGAADAAAESKASVAKPAATNPETAHAPTP